ncbi:hypothetical protein [Bifidobacterium miconis]|uniref:hypothetical protein n=1 Tax=Bifidobacterium miconis TaxID=2834435 RepID=UPI001F365B51|nr:hypothetical protein [Bifidobacterium miconis]
MYRLCPRSFSGEDQRRLISVNHRRKHSAHTHNHYDQAAERRIASREASRCSKSNRTTHTHVRTVVLAAPVYRVYNRNSGLHHYTTSKAERDYLVKLGWRDEGTSFKAVKADASNKNLKPVYCEYNRHDDNHNWTMNKAEHDHLVKLGWKDEGVA